MSTFISISINLWCLNPRNRIFKNEQREYGKEITQRNYIDFIDTRNCLDLLAQLHIGIFSLIDEECLIPKGTDQSFISKLYSKFYINPHERCAVSRIQKANGLFLVQHYTGKVEYSSTGFLDKNKEQLQTGSSWIITTSDWIKNFFYSNFMCWNVFSCFK